MPGAGPERSAWAWDLKKRTSPSARAGRPGRNTRRPAWPKTAASAKIEPTVRHPRQLPLGNRLAGGRGEAVRHVRPWLGPSRRNVRIFLSRDIPMRDAPKHSGRGQGFQGAFGGHVRHPRPDRLSSNGYWVEDRDLQGLFLTGQAGLWNGFSSRGKIGYRFFDLSGEPAPREFFSAGKIISLFQTRPRAADSLA